MSSSGITPVSSGPLIIRTYLTSSNNNTFVLDNYDNPVPNNRVLITADNGVLVPSDNINISTINPSTVNTINVYTSTLIASSIITNSLTVRSTLNTSSLIAINIDASTITTSTFNAQVLNISTANINLLNTSTISTATLFGSSIITNFLTVRSTITASTITASTINSNRLNINTISTGTINASTLNASTINASTINVVTLYNSTLVGSTITTNNLTVFRQNNDVYMATYIKNNLTELVIPIIDFDDIKIFITDIDIPDWLHARNYQAWAYIDFIYDNKTKKKYITKHSSDFYYLVSTENIIEITSIFLLLNESQIPSKQA